MPQFTEYAPGTPCWTDVTSPDLDRTVSFYSDLFGWQAERDPRPEAGGYTMFTKNGKNVAAASPPPPGAEGVPPHWSTYIATDNVEETAEKVQEAGGTLLMEPMDVFDAGRMVLAQDPAGAVFGVWQAKEHIGAELATEPGTLTWNENLTPDPERSAKFYEQVFGYEVQEADMGGAQPYRVLQVEGKSIAGMLQLTPEMGPTPPNWTSVFGVEDADAAVAKARDLGGQVLVEPFDIPQVGRYAVVQDPVGAVFGVLAG
jgi:predicted enzyme related to lactoylglutathione lyase